MSEISAKEVKRLAALGRLQLTNDEVEKATENLGAILSNFKVIQQIDTTDVPTADDASGLKNQTRVDEAAPNTLTTPERLLELAPAVVDQQIQVKAVFD